MDSPFGLSPRICLEATTVEIETLTPRLVGLEQVRPALDASGILLTHRALNNGTFLLW